MILAILQARVSSSRLPGKVLKSLLGVPMLLRQIERLQKSQKIDQLLVAISTEPTDDLIYKLCKENGIECHRGSLDDVLDRFYQAARVFTPEHVVRLTADCPLTDPQLIDEAIEFYTVAVSTMPAIRFRPHTLMDWMWRYSVLPVLNRYGVKPNYYHNVNM